MNDGNQNESLRRAIEQEEAEIRLRSLTAKRWLRTNEVALYLGITVAAAKKRAQKGILPTCKIGRRLYFDRPALDSLIESSGLRSAQTTTRSKRWE